MSAAQKLGIKFGEAIIQDDTTYMSDVAYDDPSWNIFRIRVQDGKQILTMKHHASSRSRDNHEFETVVEDSREIVKMLNRLGYTLGVRVFKERRIAHYHGLELCLDELDQLGSFVEVEKLAGDDADVDAIQGELWSLLASLGIDSEDRVHKGYDTLMRRHISGASE